MSCSCKYDVRVAGGEGSRTEVDMEKLKEAGWIVEAAGKRYKLRSPSPERKTFRSTKDVAAYLKSRNIFRDFARCYCRGSEILTETSDSDEDYRPDTEEEEGGISSACDETPVKGEGPPCALEQKDVPKGLHLESTIELPIGYYVGMTNQLDSLLDQVNSTRCCATPGCNGLLFPTSLEKKGLGGAIKLYIACSGCGIKLQYASSMMCLKERRRSCVSLALGLCFLIWGHGYPAYHKILKLGLGIPTLTSSNFYNIVKLAHPCVKSVLDEICEMGKSEMKRKPPSELGSWKKAVTTSDGCWLIRGHHSQCCTFAIINFLTGCTLYYGHSCMRGSNNICDSGLWQGTAKAAEGHLAEDCFSKAKEEEMVVAINWQDADSSSAKSFRYVFPDSSLSRVMLCGGHVGRAHANNLKEHKGKKQVDQSFVASYIKNYPQLSAAKCECYGKRAHSRNCGCMSDEFLARAKSNHFSALKQSGNDPKEYATRMRILGKYHSRDIHEWVGDDGKKYQCPWHPQRVCSCGDCDRQERSASVEGSGVANSVGGDSGVAESVDLVCEANQEEDSEDSEGSEESEDSADSDGEHNTNLRCEGKPYQVRSKVLTCELHSLLYEIECDRMAEKANEVIDPVMGRGHSNLPESKFHVLTKFRPKDVNLHQLHYEVSTNMGLCQSNMTFLIQRKGPSYHWVRDLFRQIGLPEVDGLDKILEDENLERMRRLDKKKTEKVKRQRITHKQLRQQEQKKRRQFTKRQRIVHSYGDGDADDELNEEEALATVLMHHTQATPEMQSNAGPSTSEPQKKCACGGTDHMRRSSLLCPLNKRHSTQD